LPLDIHEIAGPLRVLAGPGTGKTHALVDLYEQAIRERLAGRGEILVLTFSKGAAGEISRRIDERLQDEYGEAWISTFHSFCDRLLREHSLNRDRLLLDKFQEWLVMRQVLAELDPALLGPLEGVRRSDAFAQDLLTFVALMKQNLVHPSALMLAAEASAGERLRVLAAVYQAYERRLQSAGMLDFRDLISGAIELLQSNAPLRESLRQRFRLILVDEFQDVDPAQFELLKLLAPPQAHPRLVVVGDPDQSIYGFRGTVPRLLSRDFAAVYGSATRHLDECRRSSREALDAGERLLAATHIGREPRRMRTTVAPAPPAIVVSRERDPVDEAFFVAREIKRMHAESSELRHSDFAILLRSTYSFAPLEEALRALGVPYEVRGSSASSRNEVVRFLVGYLESLRRPDDPDAFEGALASSLGGVGARTLGRLRAHARERSRPLKKVMDRLMYALAARDAQRYPLPWGGEPPTEEARPEPDFMVFLDEAELASLHAAMVTRHKLLVRASKLSLASLAYSILIEDGGIGRLLDLELPEEQRVEAIADLRAAIDGLEAIEAVHERLHGLRPKLSDISGSLETLLAAAADDTEAAPGARDAVQVMTVHQAKGLEFEVVFCAGFAHGLFPLPVRPHPLLDPDDRAWLEQMQTGFKVDFMPSWPSDPDGHLAEEARLAYVAMTRARRRLYLTYADSYLRQAGPSAFLAMAAPDAAERVHTRGSSRLEPGDVLLAREAEVLLASHRPALEQMAALGVPARAAALGLDIAFLTDPDAGEPFESFGPGRNPAPVQIDHFSPTTLNDYLKCPRLYWYNHHPGLIDEPRSVAMERGGFLHKVLEDFHAHEGDWRPLDGDHQKEWLETALQSHLETYLSHMEGVLDRKREERQVRSVLTNYIKFVTGMQLIRRLRTVAIERRFSLQLNGSEIVGKIDRVNDVGDGEVEVVDYKTGSGKPMKYAYEAYFGPELYDVQLALYYIACREGFDEEGKPLGFTPRYLSLFYPKDWVWGGMRQDIFSVGRAAGLKEYREKLLTEEDLERSRAIVVQAIERIKAGHFEPAPRELAGTCVTRFGGCPHAAVCPYGGAPPE
jgi:DNA helicase-2/ATP-dependent DNA helicase PcrA